MRHFIYDFETFDGNPLTCVAFACAYTWFDDTDFIDDPYTPETLKERIKFSILDINEQSSKLKYTTSKSAVDFWSKNKEVMKIMMKNNKPISVSDFCSNIADYALNNKTKFWWARSCNFDGTILQRMFIDTDQEDLFNQAFPYYASRDIRTFIDTKFSFDPKMRNDFILEEYRDEFIKHHPSHDIAADILRMQKIAQAEND